MHSSAPPMPAWPRPSASRSRHRASTEALVDAVDARYGPRLRRGERKVHCDPTNCGAKRAGGATLASLRLHRRAGVATKYGTRVGVSRIAASRSASG